MLLGSMMLFRHGEMGMGISWWVLVPTVLVVSLFFITVAGIVFRMHFRRSMAGAQGMVGEKGVAYTSLDPEGQVFVHGEYWRAVSEEPIAPGESVEIVNVSHLKLLVRKIEKSR